MLLALELIMLITPFLIYAFCNNKGTQVSGPLILIASKKGADNINLYKDLFNLTKTNHEYRLFSTRSKKKDCHDARKLSISIIWKRNTAILLNIAFNGHLRTPFNGFKINLIFCNCCFYFRRCFNEKLFWFCLISSYLREQINKFICWISFKRDL